MASASSSTSGTAVVCYHYPCVDGIYAALAAHLHFRQPGRPPVRFFPLTVYRHHSVEELGLQPTDTVYMCDFTGPTGFVEAAAAVAKQVIVLDHHKTAFEELEGKQLPSNIELNMDMHRSGAMIALDYFQGQGASPEGQLSEALQRAYAFVQDGDLWAWKLAGSREFASGFRSLNLEYDVSKSPSIFDTLLSLPLDEVLASGAALQAEEDKLIATVLSGAYEVQLGGQKGVEAGWGRALAVSIDESLSKHRSRLGNEVAGLSASRGLRPVAVVAYREPGMEDPSSIKLSLRGQGDDTDTTAISTAFGGGGHRLASSCIVPLSEYEGWRAMKP